MRRWMIFLGTSILALAFGFLSMVVRAETVVEPQNSSGLVGSPSFGSSHKLVALTGPGKFVSAQLTKQGGTSDLTFVSLEIDGRNVLNGSIAALRNWALTQSNPYGVVLLQSSALNLETVTIGFPPTLTYNKSLVLSVTVNEGGVSQILANVIHGK